MDLEQIRHELQLTYERLRREHTYFVEQAAAHDACVEIYRLQIACLDAKIKQHGGK